MSKGLRMLVSGKACVSVGMWGFGVGGTTSLGMLLALRRRREREEEEQHVYNVPLSVEATLPEWRGALPRCLWLP